MEKFSISAMLFAIEMYRMESIVIHLFWREKSRILDKKKTKSTITGVLTIFGLFAISIQFIGVFFLLAIIIMRIFFFFQLCVFEIQFQFQELPFLFVCWFTLNSSNCLFVCLFLCLTFSHFHYLDFSEQFMFFFLVSGTH